MSHNRFMGRLEIPLEAERSAPWVSQSWSPRGKALKPQTALRGPRPVMPSAPWVPGPDYRPSQQAAGPLGPTERPGGLGLDGEQKWRTPGDQGGSRY